MTQERKQKNSGHINFVPFNENGEHEDSFEKSGEDLFDEVIEREQKVELFKLNVAIVLVALLFLLCILC